jgi:hypothetical protein
LTTFKLSSLFLVMTLAAIAAGVFAANLVLGVSFLVVVVPALGRTIRLLSRRNMLGRTSTLREKLVKFVHSMDIVLHAIVFIATPVAAALVGATVCGAATGESARLAGEIVGALVGLVPSAWFLWRFWQRIIAVNRAQEATALNNEGALCRERGETDRALALFAEAAILNPKLLAPHIKRPAWEAPSKDSRATARTDRDSA